jgi:two-component system, cell cycle sensor histidine kinase and response regulator CckA
MNIKPISINRLLLWATFIYIFLIVPPADSQDMSRKNILVLHAYHQGFAWTDRITSGIKSVFEESPLKIEVHYEYMDTKRVHDESYLNQLAALYRTKYKKQRFDVVITSDDNAFRYLLAHHHDIFSETPVVFCGVNDFRDELIEGNRFFTGVVESISVEDTIDTVLKIHPNVNRIVAFVDQTVTNSANKKRVSEVIPRYQGRLTFDFIENTEMSEVTEISRNLPENSIVLFWYYKPFQHGHTLSNKESFDLISRYCNRPFYSFWGTYLGLGIVGGKLTSGIAHGRKAGELALRILNGEKPGDIPVIRKSPNQYMYDYASMQRFGIRSEQLPEGSIIINKPISFYAQHKRLFWQLVSAFAFLSLIIATFIVNLFKRRVAESLLRKSEDKFRSLVETTSDWIWETDRQGKYTYVSPGVKDLLGYNPYELVGKTPLDLMPPKEAEQFKAILCDVSKPPASIHQMENNIYHKTGHSVISETNAMPFFDSKGDFSGYRGIDRDITDRKQAEKTLYESEERFRTLAELLPETIYEVDLNGHILFVNESGHKNFQYTPQDVEQGVNIFDLIMERDRARAVNNIQKILHGESLGLNEYVAVRKDGSTFPVITKSTAIVLEGEAIGVRGFLIDISDRKKLEDQFHKAQKMESVGTLAGGIAHDFNNLLMGIQGRTSLLLTETGLPGAVREHLKGIEAYVKSASNLTKQLLGFARSGKYNVELTDMNELIYKTSEMFGRTRKELRLRRRLHDNLRAAEVDKSQFEQVILNLLVNAWHAMPEGGDLLIETINRSLTEEDVKPYSASAGDYIQISVTDTGGGMDKQTQERVFEPFFSTKTMGRGTGLGLASAYGIVKNHNGIIDLYSEKGKGTTFNVFLPAATKDAVKDKKQTISIQKGDETVLVVDDEPMIIDIGEKMLQNLGYQVYTAQGGREAIEIYRKHKDRIDIVVLDMIMPDLGGGKTYDQIKEINPHAKVILSSGYSINGEATEILARGCNGFLQKPFTLKELSGKLRKILNGSED